MARFKSLGTAFNRLFRNDLNDNFTKVDTELTTQKGRVDNLIANAPQPSEVVDARGSAAVLRDRLDGVDAQLADTAERTSSFVNLMQYQHLVTKKTDTLGAEYDDWAAAIQAAISENDRIEIPTGVFGISNPIKIRDYKIIHGNGRKTQLLAKVAMASVLDIDNYDTSTSYTEIENIFVHGNNLAQVGIKCAGFTNNSKISNMWIERCIADGIYLTKAWYSALEKLQIRFCNNGIRVVSTASNSTNKTSNVNCMNFKDMYIAFITNVGINIEEDSGYGNMISNSTIEACDNHGIYVKNLISPLTCLNIYMETIKKNGIQIDTGNALNIIGGYICVDSPTSRCVQVGNISKLIIKGTSMAYWGGNLEYMVYSTATLNEISLVPLSTVTKRTIYYTGKFIGSIENVLSGNGTDFGYDASSWRTRKLELTATTGYGENTNIEVVKGSSVKSSVDTGRVYQYSEKTTTEGGFGASQIALYAKINDASNTEKKIYDINNAFMTPYRMKYPMYSTANRPTEVVTGLVIYDTNLQKPVIWNGFTSKWTDFMGNNV
jgi:hypothetical protein